MPTAGPNAGGTFASADEDQASDLAWTNPSNAGASDDTYATCALVLSSFQHTDRLDCTNFGFTIPTGAAINGVTVAIHRKVSTTALSPRDYRVQLIKGGTNQGTNKATATTWPTTEATATYGGAADLWGLTLADTDINATNFGVAISGQRNTGKGGNTFSIDYVTITVDYTAGGGAFRQSLLGVGM